MSETAIRRATMADVPRIAELFTASRLHAYRGIVPEADIVASGDPSLPKWHVRVVEDGPGTFVAERGGRILGFAHMAGSELCSLHVDPASHGGGIGRALLDFCRETIGEGFYLQCLVGNEPAMAFYDKAGLRRDGEADQPIHGKIYKSVRFVAE